MLFIPFRRIFSLLLVLVFLCLPVFAESGDDVEVEDLALPLSAASPAATDAPGKAELSADFPDDTELLAQATASSTATVTQTEDETIIEDYESGFWYYRSLSQGLRVTVNRYRQGERGVLWYEADIRTNASTPLDCIHSNPENPGRQPFRLPDRLARENKLVFGISGDMFGYRKYNREKQGNIIRDGEILSSTTRKHGVKSFPNLDSIALFKDGSLAVFESDEHTCEEYLEMGATDVFSFGPWLVRNGEINPETAENWKATERRIALGYYAPYHYGVVYAEGWNTTSAGASLEWMATRMYEMGMTEALNLDGGHTAALCFMGKRLQYSNPTGIVRKERAIDSLIGLGISEYVAEYLGVGK